MDDRLSNLPQPILHHILSLLSQKEAIQTCVLSKTWRHLGITRPKLDFAEKHFPRKTGTFLHTVHKTLQRYHDQKLYIQDFLLEMSVLGVDSDSRSLLEKWIPIVLIKNNIKKLNLNILWFSVPYFTLPCAVFQAEYLEELYLSRCKLSLIDSTQNVLFKRLKTLVLASVSIEKETFEKIMSSCPSIQWLVLDRCDRLRFVSLVYIFDKAKNIRINSPFHNIHDMNWYHHHMNSCFPRLKALHLRYLRLCTKSLDLFSSNNFPCLEELELNRCYDFEEIQLSSRSIKRLSTCFTSHCKIKAAAIDAPNLLYFKLSFDHELPSPFSFTKTSRCEWKSDIFVSCPFFPQNNYTISTWLLNLNGILKALSRSQISVDLLNYMKLERDVQIEGGFDGPVVVEHLSLKRHCPNSLNCLFRICRPQFIELMGYCPRDEQKNSESLCKFLANDRRDQCYFWKHDLKEFSIQVWDKNGADWHPVEGTNLPEYTSDEQKVRFRLKWRD